MNTISVFALVVSFVFFVFGLVLFLRSRSGPRGLKRLEEQTSERRVEAESDEKLVWEAGKERSIVDVRGLYLPTSRRSVLKKTALGALVSFAAWVAARGQNLVWAEELTVARKRPAGPPKGKGSEFRAMSTHTDTPHNDRPFADTPHQDTQPTDYNDHTDSVTHSDAFHTDSFYTKHGVEHHSDVPHLDVNYHSDVPWHTDIPHSDTPHSDTPHIDIAHSDTFS